MIGVLGGPRAEAGALALAALRRSVSRTMAEPVDQADPHGCHDILLLADAGDNSGPELTAWLTAGPRKLLVFGALPTALHARLGAGATKGGPRGEWSETTPARPRMPSESRASITYSALAKSLGGQRWRRPMRRFDFADEWNTHGYGAITSDGSIWSIGGGVTVPARNVLAMLDCTDHAQPYAGLFDDDNWSVLWFDRPVGPIDSFEWRLVEGFLSSHRAGELPVVPVLREIPAGHDAAVTMRLDCDEDVESARPLFAAYRQRGVPLSLAIHTGQAAAGGDIPLIGDVIAAGGSVLSHSATHAPWWGGSYAAALKEAEASAVRLAELTGSRPRYAVSPFHQTPHYALEALRDAGYSGCIGGNISSDPAFNLARGGALASIGSGFVGATQQCMLHGDCLGPDPADPIAPFRQAFDLAFQSQSLFGYLDHPFSQRYQYGWTDEAQRIGAHRLLLDHIIATARCPLFLSEGAAMDFLGRRAAVEITSDAGGFTCRMPDAPDGAPPLAVDYRGEVRVIHDGETLR